LWSAMVTWLGAVSAQSTTFEMKKLLSKLRNSPGHCPSSIIKKMSTLAGTQSVDGSWKALKAYLPKKKLLTDPITKSLSRFTPSPCMGLAKKLGTLECCRFFGPLDQNLVKVRLVYPDFAEKKKYDKYVCRHRPQTKTRNPCNCCDLIATHTPSEYHFGPRPNMRREPSCR
jgi:hypothetical protein